MKDLILKSAGDTASLLKIFAERCAADLLEFADESAERLRRGGKVLVFGNGGSASDAQHLAAEFVNRFKLDRPPLAAIALTTDSSVLTSIGNDFGFENAFEKQVRALARSDDAVIGITTSGKSPNVLKALASAREIGCLTVALTGEAGLIAETCGRLFAAPSSDTPRVQECHIAWIHWYCDLIDRLFCEGVNNVA